MIPRSPEVALACDVPACTWFPLRVRVISARRVGTRCGRGRHVVQVPGLRLQSPTAQDMIGAMAGAIDPQAQRWLGWTRQDVQWAGRWAYLLDVTPGTGGKPVRAREGERIDLVATDPAGEWLAGSISFDGETGEVGGWLVPRFRGRGLGGALFAGAAEFAHQHLGVASVIAGTDAGNAACTGALSVAGFTPVDGPEARTLPDGRVSRSCWFRHESGQPSRC